ncbi:MAG: class D beta-lactamase [Bacteroidetes bacterium]|nr:class D beta-lactamase [Bacteroidota bacterium]
MKSIFSILLIALFFTSCERNNIQEQTQWTAICKQYGIDSVAFELADNSHDQVYYLNKHRISKRNSPASTFKIVNSLVALETSVVPDENFILPWDGVVRARVEWNKDMSMREAFKVSSVPYYQEVARRIGAVEMQKWIDTLQYGNKQLGVKVDEFWLDNTLQISVDEQVGLMKKLYFDKLPFSQRSQRIVRSMMLQEDSTDYRLYYKTGTRKSDSSVLAWMVGFIERKETQIGVLTKSKETNYKPYFFAMNIETADTLLDFHSVRLKIVKDVLRERKIIE